MFVIPCLVSCSRYLCYESFFSDKSYLIKPALLFCALAASRYIAKNIMGNVIKNLGIIFIFFSSFCFCQSDIKLDIGNKIEKKLLSDSTNNFILTNQSQFRPYIRINKESVEYTIAYDKDSFEIRYIHTIDKNFRTSKGLTINSKISLKKDEIIIYPCWEIRSTISDNGWYPVIGFDAPNIISKKDTLIMNPLTNNSFIASDYGTFKIIGFSKGGN